MTIVIFEDDANIVRDGVGQDLTADQLYDAYIALGKHLFKAVKPTEQELNAMASEISEEDIEDWVVNLGQTSGDFGFTASYIIEAREIIEEDEKLNENLQS